MAEGENIVLVGRKPPMAYVLATLTQFSNGQKEVILRARGRNISKAVDVAEIIKRRFSHEAQVKSINIGTEERTLENGAKVNVSTIQIILGK